MITSHKASHGEVVYLGTFLNQNEGEHEREHERERGQKRVEHSLRNTLPRSPGSLGAYVGVCPFCHLPQMPPLAFCIFFAKKSVIFSLLLLFHCLRPFLPFTGTLGRLCTQKPDFPFDSHSCRSEIPQGVCKPDTKAKACAFSLFALLKMRVLRPLFTF